MKQQTLQNDQQFLNSLGMRIDQNSEILLLDNQKQWNTHKNSMKNSKKIQHKKNMRKQISQDQEQNFQKQIYNEDLQAVFGGKPINISCQQTDVIPFISRKKFEEYRKNGYDQIKIGFIQRIQYQRNRLRRQKLKRQKLKIQSQKINKLENSISISSNNNYDHYQI